MYNKDSFQNYTPSLSSIPGLPFIPGLPSSNSNFPSIPTTSLNTNLPMIPKSSSNINLPTIPKLPTIPTTLNTNLYSNSNLPTIPTTLNTNLPTIPKLPTIPTLNTNLYLNSNLPTIPTTLNRTLPIFNSRSSIPGYKGRPSIDTSMIREDTYKILITPWTDERVVRIGTIGEGSCFFHSYIKGYYVPYQDTDDSAWKMRFVANLRRDLGKSLSLITPENDGTYYNRYFSDFADIPGLGLSLLELTQNISNPGFCVGDEVYQYVVDILGISLIIFELNQYGLRLTSKYTSRAQIGTQPKYVAVVNIPGHYELIGVERNIDGQILFQTLFDNNDDFIQSIDTFDILTRDANNLRNRINNLIKNIGNIFNISNLDEVIKREGNYEYGSDIIRDIGWDNFIQYLTNHNINIENMDVENYLNDINNLNQEIIELIGPKL